MSLSAGTQAVHSSGPPSNKCHVFVADRKEIYRDCSFHLRGQSGIIAIVGSMGLKRDGRAAILLEGFLDECSLAGWRLARDDVENGGNFA